MLKRKYYPNTNLNKFRRNRCTEHAILELTDKISKAMDEGKYTIGIFLDLSKAFDTVNHEILFKKLQHYGIRGICLKWFIDYLQGRTQILKFKVPLTPKLFLIDIKSWHDF